MAKIVLLLDDETRIDDYLALGISTFLVGSSDFSSQIIENTNLDTIANLATKYEIFVSVNNLYHESFLAELENYLLKLSQIGIKGILFQDFAILQICQNNNINFDLIYDPETLNTNYATMNYLAEQGINGFMVSREINIEEMITIRNNTKALLMTQIHGVSYVTQSNRHLVTNYFDEEGLSIDTSYEAGLTIHAANVNSRNHIYEDKFGTKVMTTEVLNTLDRIDDFKDFDLLYINTMYLRHDYIVSVVLAYMNLLNNLPANISFKEDDITYTHGFLNDSTVYTIENVRKRENNGNK